MIENTNCVCDHTSFQLLGDDKDFVTDSLRELKGPIRTAVTTYYDQLVTKVEIRPEIMAMTVPRNEQNGLHELKEYIFRVFLETLYGMMESGQVSGLDKTKIKVNFLEGMASRVSQIFGIFGPLFF